MTERIWQFTRRENFLSLIGDLNMRSETGMETNVKLASVLEKLYLTSTFNLSTHSQGRQLDYVLVKRNIYHKYVSGCFKNFYSDHMSIFLRLCFEKNVVTVSQRFNKIDREQIDRCSPTSRDLNPIQTACDISKAASFDQRVYRNCPGSQLIYNLASLKTPHNDRSSNGAQQLAVQQLPATNKKIETKDTHQLPECSLSTSLEKEEPTDIVCFAHNPRQTRSVTKKMLEADIKKTKKSRVETKKHQINTPNVPTFTDASNRLKKVDAGAQEKLGVKLCSSNANWIVQNRNIPPLKDRVASTFDKLMTSSFTKPVVQTLSPTKKKPKVEDYEAVGYLKTRSNAYIKTQMAKFCSECPNCDSAPINRIYEEVVKTQNPVSKRKTATTAISTQKHSLRQSRAQKDERSKNDNKNTNSRLSRLTKHVVQSLSPTKKKPKPEVCEALGMLKTRSGTYIKPQIDKKCSKCPDCISEPTNLMHKDVLKTNIYKKCLQCQDCGPGPTNIMHKEVLNTQLPVCARIPLTTATCTKNHLVQTQAHGYEIRTRAAVKSS